MGNIFIGYKNFERVVNELYTRGEISLCEYEEIIEKMKAFHNKRGESTIFRISKDHNNKTIVDYSI